MNFPRRPEQHITETTSFKIFSRNIPNYWLIREVAERDYGIDCYVELVTTTNEVTGKLISVQLKAQKNIEWLVKEPEKCSLYGINIETTNYWYHFAVPVFLFLVDCTSQEVYFLNVKKYIRENYVNFLSQGVFNYKVSRHNSLSNSTGIDSLVLEYSKELSRNNFETNVILFFANLQQYSDFYQQNTYRDVFLGIETSRFLFAKSFYDNICFLVKYLNLNWDLEAFAEYIKISQKIFGYEYELYEQQLAEIVTKLNEKIIPISLGLRTLVTQTEQQFWLRSNLYLYNFISNIKDDGSFEDF